MTNRHRRYDVHEHFNFRRIMYEFSMYLHVKSPMRLPWRPRDTLPRALFIWRVVLSQWHRNRRYVRMYSTTLSYDVKNRVIRPTPSGGQQVRSNATSRLCGRWRRTRRFGLGSRLKPGVRAQGRSAVQAVPVPIRGPQA